MVVNNRFHQIELRIRSKREKTEWVHAMENLGRSIWVQPHPHDSFAPVRERARAKWYVDAKDYYWAISEAVEEAKECVYIMDWWLSPELVCVQPSLQPMMREVWWTGIACTVVPASSPRQV